MSGRIHPETLQETQVAGFSYSYEIEQEAIPGEGKARRVYSSTGPIPTTPEGVTNLIENIQVGISKSGDRNFLGHREMNGGVAGEYQWETYNQVFIRMKNVGYSLVARGYKSGENLGIFSINRPEWLLAEYGCYWGGIVTVPLYDTLGDEAIEFIVQRTEMPAIFATSDKAAVLLKIADKLPSLKTVFLMDSINDDLKAAAAKTSIVLVEIKTLEKEGLEKPCPCVPLTPDSIATISFTSGTTGLPKGVLISHGNLLAFLTGYQKMAASKQVFYLTNKDIHISYLPLAHVFERIIQVTVINAGGSIGFYQGDTLKLMDDCAVLKPTIFASVPRLYNRIYDRVLAGAKAAGGIKSMLFNTAYKAKKYWLTKGYIHHSVWDKLVFSNVRQRLGGNVRWMVTGAAPISADVIDFLRICFSSNVTEGYGQTEGTGGSTCTHFGDMEAGHVGPPMPHVLCKLRDVPAMNYTSADKPYPRGEICFKGASIFKGYYKEEEKTKETLSEDGWCYTGDVGYWDAKGRLRIIDRVKNIFKLAQGEYIAPEKIEIVYGKHEIVAQSFVYGDSLQSTLVAIVVPDEQPFVNWAHANGFPGKSFAELCADDKVCKAVQKLLDTQGRENGLKGFENVKAVYLTTEAFSVENDCMTPTFKLKRHQAKLKYKPQIDAMYASLA